MNTLKRMHKKDIDILVVGLGSPLLVGLYADNKLFKEIKSDKHTSEILPEIFNKLYKQYNIVKLFYARGPGSFMSIKVTYIFLKTFAIIKNIPFFAIDAFYFNENHPIKAVGKLYFVTINKKIQTKKLDITQQCVFSLPSILKESDFDNKTAPKYAMDAIY